MSKKIKKENYDIEKQNYDNLNISDECKDKLYHDVYNLLLEMDQTIKNIDMSNGIDFRYIEAIISIYSQKIINISQNFIILNLGN
jgi:hypothetical protein